MKPTAIIVDIDGTLAHRTDRSPFDWKRVGEDTLDAVVASIIRQYPFVILVSGRDEVCRVETIKWLLDNDVKYELLFMRAEGDNRKDAIVKEEIYKTKIEPHYKVEFVLDDRNQVVEMWRRNGLKCLQVAEGDF